MAAPQDDHERHEQEEHERREQGRVYDPDHKDYHNWDQRENEVYRHWLDERHEGYGL